MSKCAAGGALLFRPLLSLRTPPPPTRLPFLPRPTHTRLCCNVQCAPPPTADRPPCRVRPFASPSSARSAPRPSPSLSSLAPMYLLRPLPPPPTCHAAQVERGSHCSLAHSVLAQQQVTCEERRAWGGRRAGRDDRTQRTVGRSAARPSSLTDDGRTAEERSVVGEASRGRTDAEGRPLPTAALPGAVAERDGLTD